jgi:hypothetical protein
VGDESGRQLKVKRREGLQGRGGVGRSGIAVGVEVASRRRPSGERWQFPRGERRSAGGRSKKAALVSVGEGGELTSHRDGSS